MDGVGLCLAGDVFVDQQLAAGQLERLETCPQLSTRGGYWLVFPKRLQRDLRLRNLKAWLLSQVEGGRSSHP